MAKSPASSPERPRRSPVPPGGSGARPPKPSSRQGMKVAIGDLDDEAAAKTAVRARREHDRAAARRDRARRPSRRSSTAPKSSSGPIDVLVNNAGIMQIGRFIDEDDLTARRMIDINLHGVILGCKLALERMIPRNRGHIVNISSQAGKYGAPGGATYSATKHAVVGLTEAVRGELRLMGAQIDVSYVMPFVVNTELGSGLGEARGMKHLEPSRSGRRDRRRAPDRIVEVWVPKSANRNKVLGARAAALALGGHGPRDEGRPRAGGRRPREPPQLRAARVALGAGPRGPAAAAAARGCGDRRPAGTRRLRHGSLRGRRRGRGRDRTAGPVSCPGSSSRRSAAASAATARRRATRRSGCRSAVPGPPAGSGSRPRSCAGARGRSTRRSARRWRAG